MLLSAQLVNLATSLMIVSLQFKLVSFGGSREEILEQNPELMAEYLAEVERMKAAELDERQRLLREIEQLEGEIAAPVYGHSLKQLH